jgi:hypothetical protein
MDLVEVDRVKTEPLQAALGLAQDRVTLEAVDDGAAGAFQQGALREDLGPLGQPSQGTANGLLGAAEAVSGGGIDPVDSLLERTVDRGDRLLIVLRAPAELPTPAADRPRAEPEARYLHAGVPELCGRELCGGHLNLLSS